MQRRRRLRSPRRLMVTGMIGLTFGLPGCSQPPANPGPEVGAAPVPATTTAMTTPPEETRQPADPEIAPPVSAACAGPVDQQRQHEEADVVFRGVAVGSGDGPIISPAEFEVIEYQKGTGDGVRQVTTGVNVSAGVQSFSSAGIVPRPGEEWLILGGVDPATGVVQTTACSGSQRLQAP